VVLELAECSPCLLRECPIDHRCMTSVEVPRVTAAASLLLSEAEKEWIQEPRS
jgi:heptosyltransferase-2